MGSLCLLVLPASIALALIVGRHLRSLTTEDPPLLFPKELYLPMPEDLVVLSINTPYGEIYRQIRSSMLKYISWYGIGITEGVAAHVVFGHSKEECLAELSVLCPNLHHEVYRVEGFQSCQEQTLSDRPR